MCVYDERVLCVCVCVCLRVDSTIISNITIFQNIPARNVYDTMVKIITSRPVICKFFFFKLKSPTTPSACWMTPHGVTTPGLRSPEDCYTLMQQ